MTRIPHTFLRGNPESPRERRLLFDAPEQVEAGATGDLTPENLISEAHILPESRLREEFAINRDALSYDQIDALNDQLDAREPPLLPYYVQWDKRGAHRLQLATEVATERFGNDIVKVLEEMRKSGIDQKQVTEVINRMGLSEGIAKIITEEQAGEGALTPEQFAAWRESWFTRINAVIDSAADRSSMEKQLAPLFREFERLALNMTREQDREILVRLEKTLKGTPLRLTKGVKELLERRNSLREVQLWMSRRRPDEDRASLRKAADSINKGHVARLGASQRKWLTEGLSKRYPGLRFLIEGNRLKIEQQPEVAPLPDVDTAPDASPGQAKIIERITKIIELIDPTPPLSVEGVNALLDKAFQADFARLDADNRKAFLEYANERFERTNIRFEITKGRGLRAVERRVEAGKLSPEAAEKFTKQFRSSIDNVKGGELTVEEFNETWMLEAANQKSFNALSPRDRRSLVVYARRELQWYKLRGAQMKRNIDGLWALEMNPMSFWKVLLVLIAMILGAARPRRAARRGGAPTAGEAPDGTTKGNAALDQARDKANRATETVTKLRARVNELRKQIEEAERKLKATASAKIRKEVTALLNKLRKQLTQAEKELKAAEKVQVNAQSDVKSIEGKLEAQRKRKEQLESETEEKKLSKLLEELVKRLNGELEGLPAGSPLRGLRISARTSAGVFTLELANLDALSAEAVRAFMQNLPGTTAAIDENGRVIVEMIPKAILAIGETIDGWMERFDRWFSGGGEGTPPIAEPAPEDAEAIENFRDVVAQLASSDMTGDLADELGRQEVVIGMYELTGNGRATWEELEQILYESGYQLDETHTTLINPGLDTPWMPYADEEVPEGAEPPEEVSPEEQRLYEDIDENGDVRRALNELYDRADDDAADATSVGEAMEDLNRAIQENDLNEPAYLPALERWFNDYAREVGGYTFALDTNTGVISSDLVAAPQPEMPYAEDEPWPEEPEPWMPPAEEEGPEYQGDFELPDDETFYA